MLTKFGGFLYRRRIVALCITIAVVIGATVFGLGLFGSLSNTVVGVEKNVGTGLALSEGGTN
jgi:hypothetical protein